MSTLNGFEYYKSNNAMAYSEAEQCCAELGGSVVSIGTQEEDDMLALAVIAEKDRWYVNIHVKHRSGVQSNRKLE